MKQRYRVFRRENGIYYSLDTLTKKRNSLNTTDRREARRLAQRPERSLQTTGREPANRPRLSAASDPQIATRNWQFVMDEMVKTKKRRDQKRWQTAIKDKAFDSIRNLAGFGNARRNIFWTRAQRKSFDQCLSAAHPQLRPGHDLAAVAGHRETAVAES